MTTFQVDTDRVFEMSPAEGFNADDPEEVASSLGPSGRAILALRFKEMGVGQPLIDTVNRPSDAIRSGAAQSLVLGHRVGTAMLDISEGRIMQGDRSFAVLNKVRRESGEIAARIALGVSAQLLPVVDEERQKVLLYDRIPSLLRGNRQKEVHINVLSAAAKASADPAEYFDWLTSQNIYFSDKNGRKDDIRVQATASIFAQAHAAAGHYQEAFRLLDDVPRPEIFAEVAAAIWDASYNNPEGNSLSYSVIVLRVLSDARDQLLSQYKHRKQQPDHQKASAAVNLAFGKIFTDMDELDLAREHLSKSSRMGYRASLAMIDLYAKSGEVKDRQQSVALLFANIRTSQQLNEGAVALVSADRRGAADQLDQTGSDRTGPMPNGLAAAPAFYSNIRGMVSAIPGLNDRLRAQYEMVLRATAAEDAALAQDSLALRVQVALARTIEQDVPAIALSRLVLASMSL